MISLRVWFITKYTNLFKHVKQSKITKNKGNIANINHPNFNIHVRPAYLLIEEKKETYYEVLCTVLVTSLNHRPLVEGKNVKLSMQCKSPWTDPNTL